MKLIEQVFAVFIITSSRDPCDLVLSIQLRNKDVILFL